MSAVVDPRLMSEDQLLRRFVLARDESVWSEIGVRNFDRIQVHVATFRFPTGQAIPESEHGELAGEAWERVMQLGPNFRGTTIGELRNAISTTVWNTCMDWGRRRLAREKRIAGSLDEPGYADQEGDASRFDKRIAELSREAQAVAADDEEAWERQASYAALVREAIARVTNDHYREVLHLTYVRKLDGEAIAARLGISLANVYQRRSRGNLELEKILREHRT